MDVARLDDDPGFGSDANMFAARSVVRARQAFDDPKQVQGVSPVHSWLLLIQRSEAIYTKR